MDVKDIKYLLQWWKKHEIMFPIVEFLAIRSQVLLVHKLRLKGFFWMKIFINFKRFRLQLNNLNKLFFVNKNWLNDMWIGCKYI